MDLELVPPGRFDLVAGINYNLLEEVYANQSVIKNGSREGRCLRCVPHGFARRGWRIARPKVPIIPGHEIVGRIDLLGADVKGLKIGERVGVPWLGHTCGVCPYCLERRENLCDHPLFTGYTRNGGFATMVIADARFAFPLGETGSDVSLAPLLCAGLIGWRSLVIAGEGKKIGL